MLVLSVMKFMWFWTRYSISNLIWVKVIGKQNGDANPTSFGESQNKNITYKCWTHKDLQDHHILLFHSFLSQKASWSSSFSQFLLTFPLFKQPICPIFSFPSFLHTGSVSLENFGTNCEVGPNLVVWCQPLGWAGLIFTVENSKDL